MKKIVVFIAAFIISVVNVNAQINYAKLVDTKIGTTGKGHGLDAGFTYIGATYPFGMIQFTPTYFHPGRGFTINQLSGAGCAHMENFPTLPINGELALSPNDMKSFPRFEKVNNSHAGYFSVQLKDKVVANGTVSKRTGIAQFIFPETSIKGTVIIGSSIIGGKLFKASNVKITSPNTCEGYAYGNDFCGLDSPYKIYFAAEFNTNAISYGTWSKEILSAGKTYEEGEKSGAYFTFNTGQKKTVEYKISVSYVSLENAKENLLKDNNKGDFESIVKTTENEWSKRLASIEVKTENIDRMKQFYTHLYHILIHPNIFNDINGQYMGGDFKIRNVPKGRDYYTSFSSWDTYRSQCQLIAILFPKEASDMMQSLVDFAQQSGGFGRWILANTETGIMQGDPSSIIIANSYAFGATNFDVKSAYKLMKAGATDPNIKSQNELVRPELENYMIKGYTNSPSQTLEYASADFATGQFALQALNEKADYVYFTKRAQNWKNLYDPASKWLRSKNPSSGSWNPIDNSGYQEGTRYHYFWMVPFNLKSLVDTVGYDFAVNRIDSLFTKLNGSYDWKNVANNEIWYASGNEHNLQVPWIYNWLGKPYKTTAVINRIFNEMYDSSSSGLPGNDDLGSLGSFYVFGSIGLFPMIPGVGGFSINKPQFDDITVHLSNGDLKISGSDSKSYIKTMKLNGKEYKSSWINWVDIKNGGKIEFELTSNKTSKWASKAILPSYSGDEK